jgi:hypothetical protein
MHEQPRRLIHRDQVIIQMQEPELVHLRVPDAKPVGSAKNPVEAAR